jgi:Ser/Thr protein kinase RdoA (MazF antagonist)
MEDVRFQNAATTILSNYAIPYTEITYLGHSENVTYRVQADTDTYLLRIHFPVSSDFRSHEWRQPDVIASEFMWLQAVARDTQLIVPTPIQNQQGAFVTSVVVDGLAETLQATVLHWIEGESLDDQPNTEQAAQLGTLLAHLHLHASQWNEPAELTRPAYDLQSLRAALGKIALLEQKGLISSNDITALTETMERLEDALRALPKTRENWGIIHADMNEGNYLFHSGAIRPIDFSSCGFGYFLFDITTAFLQLIPDNRQAFLTAYVKERALSPLDDTLLETFFLWAILDNFGVLATKPEEHDYLAQDIPQVVNRLCRSYLNGTPFLNVKAHS